MPQKKLWIAEFVKIMPIIQKIILPSIPSWQLISVTSFHFINLFLDWEADLGNSPWGKQFLKSLRTTPEASSHWGTKKVKASYSLQLHEGSWHHLVPRRETTETVLERRTWRICFSSRGSSASTRRLKWMLATSKCSMYSRFFLVANKLEEMLRYIGKVLQNLPGGHYLLFLVAAWVLQVGHTCQWHVPSLLSCRQQWDGQWQLPEHMEPKETWNPELQMKLLH